LFESPGNVGLPLRITVVAVGKGKAGPERDLFEEYAGRLRWPMTLKEVEEHRKVPPAQLAAREGELLLAALPKAGLRSSWPSARVALSPRRPADGVQAALPLARTNDRFRLCVRAMLLCAPAHLRHRLPDLAASSSRRMSLNR